MQSQCFPLPLPIEDSLFNTSISFRAQTTKRTACLTCSTRYFVRHVVPNARLLEGNLVECQPMTTCHIDLPPAKSVRTLRKEVVAVEPGLSIGHPLEEELRLT